MAVVATDRLRRRYRWFWLARRRVNLMYGDISPAGVFPLRRATGLLLSSELLGALPASHRLPEYMKLPPCCAPMALDRVSGKSHRVFWIRGVESRSAGR